MKYLLCKCEGQISFRIATIGSNYSFTERDDVVKNDKNAKKNELRHIRGKRIKRTYVNAPAIALSVIAFLVSWATIVFKFALGKFSFSGMLSDVRIAVAVCFGFAIPFLLLFWLYRLFFGTVLCVFTKEGIHHPKGFLYWEKVRKMEYAFDSAPRYKSDLAGCRRVIVYTVGEKHIILPRAPRRTLRLAKKHARDIELKVSGLRSITSIFAIFGVIVLTVPLYILLFRGAPGPTMLELNISFAVSLVVWAIYHFLNAKYCLEYHLFRRLLPHKRLYYFLFWAVILLLYSALPILWNFPSIWMAVIIGISLGVLPTHYLPHRRGYGYRTYRSYDRLCEIYIGNADFWEKKIAKRQQKKGRTEK